MRRVSLAVLVLFGLVSGLPAAEYKGTFVKFDEPKMVLTVDVNGAASDFTLNNETKVVTVRGESAKYGIKSFANPRLARPGAVLTVITRQQDGKDVVTEIRLGGKKK